MEDASRLDDSGEGTLERPMRQPLPPPRYFIYIYQTIAWKKCKYEYANDKIFSVIFQA